MLPEGKNVGSPTVGGPFVHRLYLTDQRVEGSPSRSTSSCASGRRSCGWCRSTGGTTRRPTSSPC
ncbi:MAG: hypothetical protein U0802_10150 [Candidatus Binatia bacterium]